MFAVFIFVIAIVTNAGEIQMKALPMNECPDTEAFQKTMDKYIADKQFLGWNAICIPPTGGA